MKAMKSALKRLFLDRRMALVMLISTSAYQTMDVPLPLAVIAGFVGMWSLFVLLFS